MRRSSLAGDRLQLGSDAWTTLDGHLRASNPSLRRAIYFDLFDSRPFGLLVLLNATQHEFIDVHATGAPLPRGELFDGPFDPAGSGIGLLGRFDPAHPVETTDGREVVPQGLRLAGSGEGTRRSAGTVGSGSDPKTASLTVSPARAPAPPSMALFTRNRWLPEAASSSAARKG